MSCANFDSFDTDALTKGLETRAFGRVGLRYFPLTDSTNDQARKLAAENAPEGTIVVAETQTKGRGRLDRTWHSPPGAGLYFSIILRPKLDPFLIPTLTIMAGVAVAQAIERTTGIITQVKWPNDILIKERKAGGILAECHLGQQSAVVLGIGLNTHLQEKDFPPELQQKATSLAAHAGGNICRVTLLQSILKSLESWYLELARGTTAAVIGAFRERCPLIGLQARIRCGEEIRAGLVVDVDEQGCLLLQDASGHIRTILSGEVLAWGNGIF